MKTLLDTCVLSELRKAGGHPAVKSAINRLPDDTLFLSVLTTGEVAKGIALLPSGNKKRMLSVWLNGLRSEFGDRILPIDVETTQLWGELTARLQRSGVVLPAIDGLIAATALRQGMQLMTRNTRHFEATGVFIIDPWQEHLA